jgi:hypothetical protein
MKYQRHSSEESSLYDRAIEIVRFMKWASNCEMSCFEVSKIQIFQGLLGFYLSRLITRTEKERIPSPSWMRMPRSPVIEQLSPSSLLSALVIIIVITEQIKYSKTNILLDLLT